MDPGWLVDDPRWPRWGSRLAKEPMPPWHLDCTRSPLRKWPSRSMMLGGMSQPVWHHLMLHVGVCRRCWERWVGNQTTIALLCHFGSGEVQTLRPTAPEECALWNSVPCRWFVDGCLCHRRICCCNFCRPRLMERLRHPNIVEFHEALDTPLGHKVFIVVVVVVAMLHLRGCKRRSSLPLKFSLVYKSPFSDCDFVMLGKPDRFVVSHW